MSDTKTDSSRVNNARVLNGTASIFLDSLRLGAALTVLICHARDQWLPSQAHIPAEPGHLAHTSVIIFFVLSGFVIAHTTSSNNRGPIQYAQARFSRLCSVVLPALLITAFVEVIISFVDPSLRLEFSRGTSWPRYLLSGLFLNEIWLFSAAPPINIPLWSLSFEFWYYVIFGLFFYRRNQTWKAFLPTLLACLIAGPKILLMMPIWLAGCVAYRLPRLPLSRRAAWWLVFGALFIASLFIAFLSPFPYPISGLHLKYANQFITDWIIGLFFAIALWNLPTEKEPVTSSTRVDVFRTIADLTFPIYVLHYPLLLLWRAVFSHRINDNVQMWQAILTVLFLSAGIGFFLEKQRPAWVHFFRMVLNLIRAKYVKLVLSVNYSSKI